MPGRQVGFPEEHQNKRIRMAAANLADLLGGVAIAGADLAQVFARHTVKTVEAGRVLTRGGKKFEERRPVIAPIEIETDALAKLGFIERLAGSGDKKGLTLSW